MKYAAAAVAFFVCTFASPALAQESGTLQVEAPELPPVVMPDAPEIVEQDGSVEPPAPVDPALSSLETMPEIPQPVVPPVTAPSLQDAADLLEGMVTSPGAVAVSPPDPSQLSVTAPQLPQQQLPQLQFPQLGQVPFPDLQLGSDFQLTAPNMFSGQGGTLQVVPFPQAPQVTAPSASGINPPLSAAQLRESIRQDSVQDGDDPQVLPPQAAVGLSFGPAWLLFVLLLGVFLTVAVMTIVRRRESETEDVPASAAA